MHQSSLGKKLQPAKKAWKRFTTTLNSKLHTINCSKAINIIKTNSNHLLSFCSLHFFRLFKRRSITRPTYRSHQYNNNNNRHLYQYYYSNKSHVLHKNFSPIHIDQLYSLEGSGSVQPTKNFHARAETSRRRGKEVVDETRKEEKEKEKVLYSIEDAWREVVAKSPQLRPVDERAEEFISKFRQDMKLQKENSNLEFEEMLARGA